MFELYNFLNFLSLQFLDKLFWGSQLSETSPLILSHGTIYSFSSVFFFQFCGQNLSVKSQIKFKICGNEPRYNEPRYDKIPAVINILSGRSQQSVKTTDLSRNHGLL